MGCTCLTIGAHGPADRSFDVSTDVRESPKRSRTPFQRIGNSSDGLSSIPSVLDFLLCRFVLELGHTRTSPRFSRRRTMAATLMVFFVLDIQSRPIRHRRVGSCYPRTADGSSFSFTVSCAEVGHKFCRFDGGCLSSNPAPCATSAWVVRNEGRLWMGSDKEGGVG